MAKLVVLNEALKGSSYELKGERTTVGRVEDNAFQIPESSVSSHHCEILLRGSDVVVKDLNSTNGTFINGQPVTESVLKPGQTLRLGQVELRLEVDGVPVDAGKKSQEQGVSVPRRGVSLNDLEQGNRGATANPGKGFAKKDNKVNKIFLIGGIVVGVIIVALLLVAYRSASQ